MKIRIAKFYGAGVPIALLLATLLGRGNAALALFCPMLVFQLLALGGHETFRVNAAKQMSGGRITFSALIVLVLTVLFVAASAAFAPFALRQFIFAAALLCLARLACEHAAAHADLTSALVGDTLTGILLAGALLITDISGICETGKSVPDATTTSGSIPILWISFPLGVKYLLVVSVTAEPSDSARYFCTIPFPYVCVPINVPYS